MSDIKKHRRCRILYVCEICAPESCGRQDPTELAILPDGRRICGECHGHEDDVPAWSDLPKQVDLYAVLAACEASRDEARKQVSHLIH